MKRLTYISSLLCAVALAGCSNDDFTVENNPVATQPTDGVTLVATAGSDTRTTVNGYNVLWSSGDAFYAFGGTLDATNGYPNKGTFTLKEGDGNGAGTKTGTFSDALTGTQDQLQYAVYVKDVETNFKPLTSTLTFPTSYTYPNSSAPMFGTYNATDKKVTFTQLLCGMIRVKVTDVPAGKKGSLVLSAQGIAGDATLTISDNQVTVGTITGSESDAVTLSFTTTAGEMLLDIPVPAATYTNGITATLTIDDVPTTFTTTSSFVVTAQQIREMQSIKVIEIKGGTIDFEQEANGIKAANALLAAGATRVKLTDLGTGDDANNNTIEVPADQEADIELPTLAENTELTVTGVAATSTTASVAKRMITTRTESNAIAKKVILRAQSESQGKVTLKNIKDVELNGGKWAQATVDAGCTSVAITEKAEITAVTIASTDVQEITVAGDATTTEISMAEGTTNTNLKATVATADAFKSALALSNNITLGGDITLSSSVDITGTKVIDLNNKQISMTGSSTFKVLAKEETTDANSLTLKNGTISGETNSKIAEVYKQGILVVEGIETPTNNAMTYPFYANAGNPEGSGDGTNITIKDCKIYAQGQAFATNAASASSTDNYQSLVVSVTNSTLAASAGFLTNVPSTVTITGSTIIGGLQGLIVRGGSVTCTNTTITKDRTYNTYSNADNAFETWQSGNKIKCAAIVLGNKDAGGYDYATTLSLTGCTVQVLNSDNTTTVPAVYAHSKDKNTVTFTYDNSCTFPDANTNPLVYDGEGITVNGSAANTTSSGTESGNSESGSEETPAAE